MNIEPVAYFHSPFATKFGVPRQSGVVKELRGEIHFTEGYRVPEALRGMEAFDYLWLIWGFSANRERDGWQPTVRPPRLGGNTYMGVFATRSPYRPNPLGLSSVKLDHIDWDAKDGPVIHVLGADLMDGTPIYDIKPYVTYADSHPEAASGFVDASDWRPLEVEVAPEAQEAVAAAFSDSELATLKEVLAQDPRPHYHHDPEKEYGMAFAGHDVHFKVGDKVTIVGLTPLS